MTRIVTVIPAQAEIQNESPHIFIKIAACLAIVVAMSGCTMTKYLMHAAAGEARILFNRRPIDEALQQQALAIDKRKKLAWIAQSADAAERLGLNRKAQYREVAELPDNFNVWVLALAEPDRLETVTWKFPIAGKVPYLGFFDRDKALAMAQENYPDKDRYLRTAAAFSTLGYLPDPILPAFFAMDDEAIVNLVVHELVHATLYIAGDSTWNESVASALGDAGQELILEAWGRADLLAAAADAAADRERWAALVAETLADLRAAYAATSSSESRLAVKKARIAQFQAAVSETQWRNPRYRRYASSEINHAFLLANEVYQGDAAYQAGLKAAAKNNFAATLVFLKCVIENSPDQPWKLPGRDACP